VRPKLSVCCYRNPWCTRIWSAVLASAAQEECDGVTEGPEEGRDEQPQNRAIQKAGTLQLREKAPEKDLTEVYKVMKVVEQVSADFICTESSYKRIRRHTSKLQDQFKTDASIF